MHHKETVYQIIKHIETIDSNFAINNESLEKEIEKSDDHQSTAIKILSIIGGILASFAFLGFLFLTGIYDSDFGLLFFGILSIVGSIVINKLFEKTIMDTLSVSAYIIGFILLGLAFAKMDFSTNIICILMIILALVSLLITQNYVVSFIAILIINGAILVLIAENEIYQSLQIYTSVLALIITYFYTKEAAIITKNKSWNRLYSPARIAFTFAFLVGLSILTYKNFTPISVAHVWISSIFIIAAILYVISLILKKLLITNTTHKWLIYVGSTISLGLTALSPAISGAILIILLSFLVNYKSTLIIGIIAFIVFISQFYYDLNFTLLTKSILLLSSGVLFLVFYFFTHKKLSSNEKI